MERERGDEGRGDEREEEGGREVMRGERGRGEVMREVGERGVN